MFLSFKGTLVKACSLINLYTYTYQSSRCCYELILSFMRGRAFVNAVSVRLARLSLLLGKTIKTVVLAKTQQFI